MGGGGNEWLIDRSLTDSWNDRIKSRVTGKSINIIWSSKEQPKIRKTAACALKSAHLYQLIFIDLFLSAWTSALRLYNTPSIRLQERLWLTSTGDSEQGRGPVLIDVRAFDEGIEATVYVRETRHCRPLARDTGTARLVIEGRVEHMEAGIGSSARIPAEGWQLYRSKAWDWWVFGRKKTWLGRSEVITK